MNILLSTRNPGKALQIKTLFNHPNLIIQTLDDLGIAGEAIEDGASLQENALKKAQYAFERMQAKQWVMSEDTGLFITALGGAPGIWPARWAGESATTEEIMQYTLNQLDTAEDRSARFQTTVALLSPDNDPYFFQGICKGKILDAPRMAPTPKMPYSSIFMPNGTNKVWAEMTTEEINDISHRGKAFRRTEKFLKQYL